MRHIILGTAGHIDHGKSTLVKALTGIDPDRLKEEKERGITIDIGFADLLFPEDSLGVGIVDVPGHERLISNMLAGAGGIDMVLLVIAADEGVMPQSREHLAICNLLAIKSGIIVLTKSDLVDRDWLSLMQDEVRQFVQGSFLEKAPLVAVSSKTGENLDALKEEIRKMGLTVPAKKTGGLFRLPIDRVFTLKGFGTVVTGTAVSGTLKVEENVEIMPRGISTKVRGLQSHGKPIREASAGQRAAINLQGIEKEELSRGDVVVPPGTFRPTRALDAHLELLRDAPLLKSRSLVHLYLGTAETVARVILFGQEELRAGEKAFCQFRLQDPLIAASGDRFIIRRFSPLETLGGGEVLDPLPGRRRRKEGVEDLVRILEGDLEARLETKIERAGAPGIAKEMLRAWINAELPAMDAALAAVVNKGAASQSEGVYLHRKWREYLAGRVESLLDAYHKANPLKQGMQKEELRTLLGADPKLFQGLLSGLASVVVDRDVVRKKSFRVELSNLQEESRGRILGSLEAAGFQPPNKAELAEALKLTPKQITDMLNVLVKENAVRKISEAIYMTSGHYDRMLGIMREFFAKKPEMTVAEFRDLINTSRKYALPILEHLDVARITLRVGDVRKLIRKN